MIKRFLLWLIHKVELSATDKMAVVDQLYPDKLGLVVALNPSTTQKLEVIEKLYPLTYEPTTLDKVNGKLIRPVPGLLIDGVQYWEFVNLADMPEARRMHYNLRRQQFHMGLEEELLLEYIALMKEANNKSDASRMGSLLFMLEDTTRNLTTPETLLHIASIAYFDAKEDIASYDLDYNQRKIDKFRMIPDKGFFFDRLLRESLKVSAESYQGDIEAYLQKSVAKLTAFAQIRGGRNSS
jgi:hypothetical protein